MCRGLSKFVSIQTHASFSHITIQSSIVSPLFLTLICDTATEETRSSVKWYSFAIFLATLVLTNHVIIPTTLDATTEVITPFISVLSTGGGLLGGVWGVEFTTGVVTGGGVGWDSGTA